MPCRPWCSRPRSAGGAQRHGRRSGAGGGLRGHISRLFADVARVLDGFTSSCIQPPPVDASIQDLDRCVPDRFLWQAAQTRPPHHGLGVDQAQRLPGGHVRFPCCRTSFTRPGLAFHPPTFGPPFPFHARPQRPFSGLGLFRPLGAPAC